MIHPTAGAEITNNNINELNKTNSIDDISNIDEISSANEKDSIDNPASIQSLNKISDKVDGSGLSMRNIVNSIDLINTANDVMNKGSEKSASEKMEGQLAESMQQSVQPEKSDNLMTQLNDQLSIYKNAAAVDTKDNIVQEMASENNVYEAGVQAAVQTKSPEPQVKDVNPLDDTRLKTITDLASAETEKKIDDAFDSKGTSGKAGGLGDKIKDLMDSMGSNPEMATSIHSGVSAPETLAMLK